MGMSTVKISIEKAVKMSRTMKMVSWTPGMTKIEKKKIISAELSDDGRIFLRYKGFDFQEFDNKIEEEIS